MVERTNYLFFFKTTWNKIYFKLIGSKKDLKIKSMQYYENEVQHPKFCLNRLHHYLAEENVPNTKNIFVTPFSYLIFFLFFELLIVIAFETII